MLMLCNKLVCEAMPIVEGIAEHCLLRWEGILEGIWDELRRDLLERRDLLITKELVGRERVLDRSLVSR